jgi:NAD(P)-dependent dehydrogenase (short-subunit alcohol dehydrogenase family)
MSLVSLLRANGPSGFGYGSTAEQVTAGFDLSGKTYLLTGCNSGLGRETLRVLRLRGARVFGTGRTLARAQPVCEEYGATPIACELSEPASVLACVAELLAQQVRLDAIICNAGIMALPKLSQRSGYELQFFTNHIGHFLLVTRLLPLLAPTGRVVMVSSNAHRRAPSDGIQFDNLGGEKAYKPWLAYGQSKLANLLFARQLARRLAGTSQTANALHPGVIATNLARNMSPHIDLLLKATSPLFLKSIPEGAATQCYVATHPSLAAVSGEYFSHCNLATSTALGRDLAMAERLWDVSERIVEEVTA